MDWVVRKSDKGLKGEINIPPDKSVSHRAVMFGSISEGRLCVKNFLFSEDCMRTYDAFREMGIEINRSGTNVHVKGKGLLGLLAPSKPLYLGNSGTTMRILSGILAAQPFKTVLTGDESLSSRPMNRILEPLRSMGANIKDIDGKGHAPLEIDGSFSRLNPISYKMPVASAQVKSCVLAAGLFADGITTVSEPFQSRDHTERMLKHLSAEIRTEGLVTTIKGGSRLVAEDVEVPGDISSAAFFIVAGLIVKGSDIIIRNVGLNPTRTGIIDVLLRMGASIDILGRRDGVEPKGDLRVRYSELKGTIIDKNEVPLMIDEIPVFLLAALSASGATRIKGISELKVKETDRVETMKRNLALMGAVFEESGEDLIINGPFRNFRSAELDSFGDHRVAMTMCIAALLSDCKCSVKNTACVETSYPGFMKDLSHVSS